MKNILFTITIIVFLLSACNRNNAKTSAPAGGDNLWFTAAGVNVTIANEEILKQSNYENYARFTDTDAPENQWLIFSTDGKAVDLGYIAIQLEYNEDEEKFYLIEDAEKCYQVIRPEMPFVVNWSEVGTMPHRGIKLEDEKGIRYFAIIANSEEVEEDGTARRTAPVVLAEYPFSTGKARHFAHYVTFNNKSIPMNIYYSNYDGVEHYDDLYFVKKFIFEYDGKIHTINMDGMENFPFNDPKSFDIIDASVDYNFDNYMDIAVLSGRGAYHSWANIFIYNPRTQTFYHHDELSKMPDVWTDAESKTVKVHGKGGHAGLIYNFKEYKWENDQLKLIHSVSQDYDEELELYICITMTLQNNGAWEEKRETFKEEDF